MFTGGSSASAEMAKEPSPDADRITIATLLHGLASVYEKLLNLTVGIEARRYQDGTGDPDYGRRLRELEGQIAEIDREQSGFRMGDYHEGGGNKWDKWAMPGLVTLAVSGIIGNVVQSMTVSALRQEVADLQKEVDHIEKLIEPRYRGAP